MIDHVKKAENILVNLDGVNPDDAAKVLTLVMTAFVMTVASGNINSALRAVDALSGDIKETVKLNRGAPIN